MLIDNKVVLNQIDAILNRCNKIIEDNAGTGDEFPFSGLSHIEKVEIKTLLAATIDRLAPSGTPYRNEAHDILILQRDVVVAINHLIGILVALRADYEAGYLESIHELIHADIFTDFLEMADYLLEEGYKDPAAVLAGGVLEEHLRKLCQKNNIPTQKDESRPKKADKLNAELADAEVYSKLDQKSVTSWLDLRNKAAHGKYDEYLKEQVALMVNGIRDFISRNPA